MSTFLKILEVQLQHPYYNQEFSKDFRIEPTTACEKLLRDHGLVFKNTSRGFALFGNVTGTSPNYVLQRSIQDGVKFSFKMIQENDRFLNFTHLPLADNQNKVYYFNNLVDNQNAGDLLMFPSNADEVVGSDERISSFTDIFRLTFPDNTLVKITDAVDGTVVFNETISGEHEFDFSGDLSGKKYNLEENNSGNVDLAFYADTSLVGKAFGIIEIHKRASVPAAYKFINSTTQVVEPKTYTIRFMERKTVWRYLVELRYKTAIDPNDLIIQKAVGTPISFTNMGFVTLPSGVKQVKFESDTEVPLQQTFLKDIELINDPGVPEVLVEDLENAGTEMIKPDEDYINNDKTYSEIFIYQ